MTEQQPRSATADDDRKHDETHPADPGKHDPGEGGEDRDILGKSQDDLTAEDLKGDSRSDDD